MTGPTFVDETPLADDDPTVPFSVTYNRRLPDGTLEQETEAFEARPKSQVPYVWLLDYFAAGVEGPSEQAAATLRFLNRVLCDDGEHTDRKRFDALIHDPAAAIKGRTLQQVQIYLVGEYERPDPTRARSAGPKRSRSGRSGTGRGSTGSRPATGSTSR